MLRDNLTHFFFLNQLYFLGKVGLPQNLARTHLLFCPLSDTTWSFGGLEDLLWMNQMTIVLFYIRGLEQEIEGTSHF